MPADEKPLTTSANRVIQLAHERASLFGHDKVGVEHILHGLIKDGLENGGGAANAIKRCGIKLETVQVEVTIILGASDYRPSE